MVVNKVTGVFGMNYSLTYSIELLSSIIQNDALKAVWLSPNLLKLVEIVYNVER